MRHSQLRAFHHVALAGGFSAAARELNLSQPAISDQVRKLEQENDILLFYREARQVRLTEAGEALFRLTRQMFDVEGDIRDMLSDARVGLSGRLRIIADAVHHITPTLTLFRRAHPGVKVELGTGNSEEVRTRVLNYEAEIGIIGNVNPGREFLTHSLVPSPVVAFAAQSFLDQEFSADAGSRRLADGLSFRDLTEFPLVFRETGSRTRSLIESAAEKAGVALMQTFVVEGREAMREVVAEGAGFGFVSLAELGADQRLRAITLTDKVQPMPESLIYMRQRRDLRVIRAFVACLEKGTAGNAVWPEK